MNIFQKQLVLSGKTMAERYNAGETLLPELFPVRTVAFALPPQRISIAEFEKEYERESAKETA